MKKLSIYLLGLCLFLIGCQTASSSPSTAKDGGLEILATTTMIADLVENIGGSHVKVTSLMKAGVDPHLYKAKESDAASMQSADLVFYNGIHLEAKLSDVLEKLPNTSSMEAALDKSDILEEDGGEDPHIWFDISLWKKAATHIKETLAQKDAQHADDYAANLTKYLAELDDLQSYVTKELSSIPKEQRVLVTAHDAFNYFARSNDFQVKAIQGVSTESEASTSAINALAEFLATNQIKAIFTESSISHKTIESLQKAVQSKGVDLTIGDELYSDSLKENSSYIETYKLNVDAIVKGLK